MRSLTKTICITVGVVTLLYLTHFILVVGGAAALGAGVYLAGSRIKGAVLCKH